MPPAHSCSDQNQYGPPCDLWSAGVVLYMLLAGVPPFHHASEPKLLRAIMAGKYDLTDPVWEPVSGAVRGTPPCGCCL
jgi:calcium/calmodulin-dependent protein kinase I